MVEVNAKRKVVEANYENNKAMVKVVIPPPSDNEIVDWARRRKDIGQRTDFKIKIK